MKKKMVKQASYIYIYICNRYITDIYHIHTYIYIHVTLQKGLKDFFQKQYQTSQEAYEREQEKKEFGLEEKEFGLRAEQTLRSLCRAVDIMLRFGYNMKKTVT